MTHRTTSCPCSHITMNVNKHTNIPQHEVFFVGPYIHDCVIFHFDTPSCLRCAVLLYKLKSQIGCLCSLHVDIIMAHHPTAHKDQLFTLPLVPVCKQSKLKHRLWIIPHWYIQRQNWTRKRKINNNQVNYNFKNNLQFHNDDEHTTGIPLTTTSE